MDKLYSPATIQRVKNKYGFHLSKSLGQNFLADGNIVDHIINGSGITESDLVIEIGPGIGVLTAAAAKKAAYVIGVEIDRNLIPILNDTLSGFDNIEIINRDFMKTDLNSIIRELDSSIRNNIKDIKIIGNLPYYITTPIIMKILEEQDKAQPLAESLTFMMQKEVADRIRATPGSKIYGSISVAVQYYCDVDMIVSVPKEVFVPKPKVDSAVLLLKIRKKPPVDLLNDDYFFSIVKAGFGQRRKTLGNALTGLYGLEKDEARAVLVKAGIDPERRAETLSIYEFADAANALFHIVTQK